MEDTPIFIHSLFRSGSTYMFQVFRRSQAGYWCYQEALHEDALFAHEKPAALLNSNEKNASMLRHPKLDKPYFQELYATWHAWKGTLSASAVYDAYFSGSNHDTGIPFWRALIDSAKGRPVFQECRTSCRIKKIKKELGGYHIYLWRNPWDQWWSYKTTPYFDAVNQLLVNIENKPDSLKILQSALGLISIRKHEDVFAALQYHKERPVDSEKKYMIFYLLWCLGLKSGMEYADLLLNIDGLSDSGEYRKNIENTLRKNGIDQIDFSDCSIPQGHYFKGDMAFFIPLEDRIHQILIKSGWSKESIYELQSLRKRFEPQKWAASIPATSMTEQMGRTRSLVMRLETETARAAQSVYSSWSWRLTAPLRWVDKKIQGFKNRRHVLIGNSIDRLPLSYLKKNLQRLNAESAKYPILDRPIKWLSWSLPQDSPASSSPKDLNVQSLSPSANQIFNDLKTAIELNQNKKSSCE